MIINKIQNKPIYITKSKPDAFLAKKPVADAIKAASRFNFSSGFDFNYYNNINFTSSIKNYSKAQLREKLASILNDDGSFKLKNSDINLILNSENNISQIFKVLNLLEERKIELDAKELTNYLSGEEFDFEFEKEKFLIIDEINKSEDYEFLRNAFCGDISAVHSAIIKGNDFVSSKQYISNIVLLKKMRDFLMEKMPPNSLNDSELRPIYENILSAAKMKPDDFDSLKESGLIDNINNDFLFHYLSSPNFDENSDISKRIELIKQIKEKTSFLDDSSMYFANLKAILEADLGENSEINEKNLEFFKKNAGFFENADLKDKIKIITFKKEFDKKAQDFLEFLSDDSNKIQGIDPIQVFLLEDADFENLQGILSEIKKNNLEDFFAQNFISDFKENGEEKMARSVQKVKILKKYPEVCKNLENASRNLLLCFYLDNTDVEEFENRLKTLDEFIKNNPKIMEKFFDIYKLGFMFNSLFEPESEAFLSNEKRIKIADFMARKNPRFSLENRLNIEQTLGKVLSCDNLSEKELENIEKNLVQVDKLMKFFVSCAQNEDFEINLSPMIYWLSSECDLDSAMEKIKYVIAQNKANSMEIVFDVDGFEIIRDFGTYEIARKYDKNAKPISLKKDFYGVNSDSNLKKTLIKEKKFDVCCVEQYNEKAQIYYPLSMKKAVKDENGRVLYVDKVKPSEISGVLDIKRIYPDESYEIISHGERNGEFETIEKNLTSPGGTKSKITMKKAQNGDWESNYRIFSSDNKEIFCDSKSRKTMNDKSVLNIHNDKRFKIKYSGFKINVYDLNANREFTLDLEKLIKSQRQREILLLLFKQLDAWELIFIIKKVNNVAFVNKLSSRASLLSRELDIGVQKFVFEHELGHIKDISYNAPTENSDYKLSADDELCKIFEYEKANFEREFGDFEKEIVKYFIKTDADSYSKKQSLAEMTAEINGILNSSIFQQQLLFRSQLIQTNFPLTIAYLAQKLDNVK